MIRFKNTVTINRPLQEVFTFVSNFENMPKWNYYILEVKQITMGPRRIGTLYDQTRKTDKQQYQITEYEQNHRVIVKTIPPAPTLEMRFTFESAGDATHLEDEWELKTRYPGFLEHLATGRIKSAARENLVKLKRLLENGEVYLQDGRHTSV